MLMTRRSLHSLLAAAMAGLSCLERAPAEDLPAAKSVQSAESTDRIAPAALRRHVEYLAGRQLEGRGTVRGKQLAAEYIRRQFEELRLDPLFGDAGFYQEIPGSKADDGRPTVKGRNVGACLRGSDPSLAEEIVILSAHYDHLGVRGGKTFPGADDNAGSVAMLLEVSRRFAQSAVAPKRTVVFLCCDLEENLLWGSRWFVAHPPWPLSRVKLFVTSEMIGRTLGDLPLGTIFALGSEHATGLKAIVDGVPTPPELKVAHLGIDLIGTRSDYGPFWNEKVPFLFLSGGQHPDYHQPTDTADRLDYARVASVSQLVFEVCRQVADAEAAPAWTDQPIRDLDEIRTLHRITELLLSTDDAARARGKPKLNDLQRFAVSNIHSRTVQIIERGDVRSDERPWLVRSAQLLLLTVF
jgi:hypothetical protein